MAWRFILAPVLMGMSLGSAQASDIRDQSAGYGRARECVILLHGLGRSRRMFGMLADRLRESGYLLDNRSYPSTRFTVEHLAPGHIGPALTNCREAGASRIHFVTHSLGGILVRQYLQRHSIPELGRIVMLAPPNHGSEVTDRMRDEAWYRLATGPAGQQLGTERTSLPNRLGPIPGEIGILIGHLSSDPWFSWFIPGPDDGKVSLASAHLEGEKDFLVVEAGHTLIASKAVVLDQILWFLRYGRFRRIETGHGAD